MAATERRLMQSTPAIVRRLTPGQARLGQAGELKQTLHIDSWLEEYCL